MTSSIPLGNHHRQRNRSQPDQPGQLELRWISSYRSCWKPRHRTFSRTNFPILNYHSQLTNTTLQNCVAKYFTKGESPLGRTWPCDPTTSGYWTMTVLAGSSGQFGSSDLNLKFAHVADKLYRGSQYTATYEAEGHFAVGDNLKGTCGGSGVCSWALKPENTPFAIKPAKV
jgi:hypothetical protein